MIVIEYILGSIYRIAFILILLIFHPLQIIAIQLFGWKGHQKVVQLLNGCITVAFRLAGTSVSFRNNYKLQLDKTTIIVANHQSLWDIVGIYWFLRKQNPLFVSKIELTKGIPSISYNLRKSGAALINRKNRKQAISEILRMGEQVNQQNRAAVIFPEGTRSKNGQLKQFAVGGLAGLLKKCPDAEIIPVVVRGTAALEANKFYRIKMGKSISWTVLEPFNASRMEVQEVLDKTYTMIKESLETDSPQR